MGAFFLAKLPPNVYPNNTHFMHNFGLKKPQIGHGNIGIVEPGAGNLWKLQKKMEREYFQGMEGQD